MANEIKHPTKEYLRDIFYIKNGILYRKNTNKTPFFRHNGKSRRRISIDGKRYLYYRILWIYHNGDIPDGYDIDHIDRNPSNDFIENLRAVTHRVNISNQLRDGKYPKNIQPEGNKWRIHMTIEGKCLKFGSFNSVRDAVISANKLRKSVYKDYSIYENPNDWMHLDEPCNPYNGIKS